MRGGKGGWEGVLARLLEMAWGLVSLFLYRRLIFPSFASSLPPFPDILYLSSFRSNLHSEPSHIRAT